MKTKIDIKSAFIGLAGGVLVALAVAATSSVGAAGRYQISGTGNHALVIDTATGRVWQGYFAPNEGTTDGDFFQEKLDAKK